MIKDLFKKYFHFPKQQPGWPVLAIIGGATVILSVLYLPLGLLGFASFIYLCIILRRPQRVLSKRPSGQILAPIDGQVIWVHHDREQDRILIRLRPDIFNSHLAYAPIAGQIDQQIWYDGQFASFNDTEIPPLTTARQEIVFMPEEAISGDNRITMTHYGAPYSRIVQSFVQEGRNVTPETVVALGLLRTNIDVSFPASYAPAIGMGQRCLAGETVLADKIRKTGK
jgi:phosphatidylserine decarboxylase